MLTRTDLRINAALFAALAASQLFMLLLPLTGAHPAWALLAALFTNSFWALVHEAIHGHLFATRHASERGGRLLAILYGAPFPLLRSGHLLHHAFSRTRRERTEVYDERATTRLSAAPRYYAQILGGLYLSEVLAGLLLALLPARAIRALAARLDGPDSVVGPMIAAQAEPANLRALRPDALAAWALLAAAFRLYGENWPWLAAALGVRALLISFFDNSYHYATALDNPKHAINMRAPHWLGLVLLNFNRHGTHHLHANLGWRALGRIDDAVSPSVGMGYALLRQLKGPIPAAALERNPPA